MWISAKIRSGNALSIVKGLFAAVCWLLCFGVATAQENAIVNPVTPNQTFSSDTFSVDLYFDALQQGHAALIGVVGSQTIMPVGTFLERDIAFFQLPTSPVWYALIHAPLDQTIKSYDLIISVSGAPLTIPIAVTSGNFIQQDVIIVDQTSIVLNREVEDAELAFIKELATPVTPIIYWRDKGFHPPVDAALTSPFGAIRVFNGLYETLHTGWDYQAPLGKPLVAMSAGVVVFAGYTAIRGNYVLIDHGYGVYSGYAHASVVFVTQGQLVDAGQVISLVGSTGRSSSAHAHVEMLMNGDWIDSADFLSISLPS